MRRESFVGAPVFCRPIVQYQLPIRCFPPFEYSSPLDTVNRLKHDRLRSRHSVGRKIRCSTMDSDVQLSNFLSASKPLLRKDKIVPALPERRHSHNHRNSAIPNMTGPRPIRPGLVHISGTLINVFSDTYQPNGTSTITLFLLYPFSLHPRIANMAARFFAVVLIATLSLLVSTGESMDALISDRITHMQSWLDFLVVVSF